MRSSLIPVRGTRHYQTGAPKPLDDFGNNDLAWFFEAFLVTRGPVARNYAGSLFLSSAEQARAATAIHGSRLDVNRLRI
jgi:hypothetical protein